MGEDGEGGGEGVGGEVELERFDVVMDDEGMISWFDVSLDLRSGGSSGEASFNLRLTVIFVTGSFLIKGVRLLEACLTEESGAGLEGGGTFEIFEALFDEGKIFTFEALAGLCLTQPLYIRFASNCRFRLLEEKNFFFGLTSATVSATNSFCLVFLWGLGSH